MSDHMPPEPGEHLIGMLIAQVRQVHTDLQNRDAKDAEFAKDLRRISDSQLEIKALLRAEAKARQVAESWKDRFDAAHGSPEVLLKRIETIEAKAERGDNHRLSVVAAVGAVVAIISALAALSKVWGV